MAATDQTVPDGGGGCSGGAEGCCSICLEKVVASGDRSVAYLHCGHQFHLAFNAKEEMKCPNCRKVEKGNWLFAKGGSSFLEVNTNQWIDEDFPDVASDVPFGIHWCPFGRYPHASSLSESMESSSEISYHGMPGDHAIFADHIVRTTLGSCPYVAYLQLIQPPTSLTSHVSFGTLLSGTAFRHQQSRASSEVHYSHTPPRQQSQYDGWNYSYYALGPLHGQTGDAGPLSSSLRNMFGADDPLSHVRPVYCSPGDGSRLRSGLSSSSMVGLDISNIQGHHYQLHQNSDASYNSVYLGTHQSGGSQDVAPTGPTQPSTSNATGYQLFGNDNWPGQIIQGFESCPCGDHQYAREGNHFPPFPSMNMEERQMLRQGSLHHPSGSLASSSRTQQWHLHEFERSLPEDRHECSSYGMYHGPQMHHFI